MPFVEVNKDRIYSKIRIYCEMLGNGEPLLLIEGLGYATWMWYRQLEDLSGQYQAIVFDNRGVGKSDKPDTPYSIEMMAGDAAGLLVALGVRKAHVLGVSMGGLIAQALAIHHPDLVRSLVLACTTHGGPGSVPVPPETAAAMLNKKGLPEKDALREAMKYAFAPDFLDAHPEELEKIIAWRMSEPTPQYAKQRQMEAVLGVNLVHKLKDIEVPVLILTGDGDRVIPMANSELLHKAIKGSSLEVFPGGGHLFFIEQAPAFNRQVLAFLRRYPV